ncbi:MAG: sn-glycerol-3-phosphate ABC transporter ATP-binding protein UgpC [Deltaproteobacteria bacterium]|nr:sn-glycerol-3-phosphate ABC transporter ATP-binding protein UgpC [Deltaproteobacteria bacterium]
MARVRLKNISKRFGSSKVLHDINLDVEEGEFVVLVGPSGCGKSTTLRLIAGLEDVTEGEIMINNRVVNLVEPQHRNIAMVFQNYALYPHKNVRENILFGLKRARVKKDIMESKLEKVSKILQLDKLLERKPAKLSGGERQRVAMGRAIIRDADVFLFDEPLSNLDAKLRHRMRSEIRRIHREYRTTSIYVTHDQVEAMTLGDRVVVMRDGRIEQQGTPMEIYLWPVNIFVATFIGAPSMNILDVKVNNNFVELEGGKILIDKEDNTRELFSMMNENEIKLGIRPDFFMDERFVSDPDSLARIENAHVDLVEPLGFDQELNVRIGEQMIRVKLDLRTKVKEGEKIDLCFDMKRAHFFDRKTGRNIRSVKIRRNNSDLNLQH